MQACSPGERSDPGEQRSRISLRSWRATISARVLWHFRQKYREQAYRRKESADLINVGNAHMIGDAAEHRRAKTADAEGDAEEYPGDHAEAVRHQLLREYDDRRSGRRDDQPDADRQHRARIESGVRQRQRERQRAEDRQPDDVFAAETVAKRSAEKRP